MNFLIATISFFGVIALKTTPKEPSPMVLIILYFSIADMQLLNRLESENFVLKKKANAIFFFNVIILFIAKVKPLRILKELFKFVCINP